MNASRECVPQGKRWIMRDGAGRRDRDDTRDIAIEALTLVQQMQGQVSNIYKMLWATVGGIGLLIASKVIDLLSSIPHH